jgi:hypothetical protein
MITPDYKDVLKTLRRKRVPHMWKAEGTERFILVPDLNFEFQFHDCGNESNPALARTQRLSSEICGKRVLDCVARGCFTRWD